MAEITDDMGKALKAAGLGKEAVWKHKQSGKWIIYHWACEKAAANLGVVFAPPQILEADAASSVAILVTGKQDKREEWSIGEATPKNNKNAYPYAMAEKRAKDRVIVKLIGLHGLAYSEEESDDFKPEGRDITYGVGAAAPQSGKMDFWGPWGEVEQQCDTPFDYLQLLTAKLEESGAYWGPNEHAVEWIGKDYADKLPEEEKKKIKAHARSVYKLGKDAHRNYEEAKRTPLDAA